MIGNSLLVVLCTCQGFAMAFNESSHLFFDEVRSLSELPMDRLIQIKSSFGGDDVVEDADIFDEETVSSNLPAALPLKRLGQKPLRRYEHQDHEKGHDSKISKIFQLAVTTLSFLAFGGYLLTLIITAIRQNANNGNGNVIVLSSLQKYRPKRSIFLNPADNDFDTDRLYQGMVMLSRGYALYHNK
ncbi:uncharacterized protein LOC105698683 isoform X2 [Orussus abietinus]|uniref:uncharacterized protein LOC105698683 isoform X2 n=1 Tax=Orussus abietinus TaxID=222816 RepID=UPI000625141D|nr:uncharacterized protein LOC105698683 isoform X2 [Orussus abietinus]